MKKVIITGSTGMIGGLVLQLCLQNNQISQIVSLVRKSTNLNHPKYLEVLVDDFNNYDKISSLFTNVDIIYYCLGAYTGTLPSEAFRKVNFDFPLSLAKSVVAVSPNANFCLLSGQGADRSEKSKMQFARDKGAVENSLSLIGFKSFHTFRPGYIYPSKKRKEPNFFYLITRYLYPIVKILGKSFSITDEQLAYVIFSVGLHGYEKEILENQDMRLYHFKI